MKTNKIVSAALLAVALLSNAGVYAAEIERVQDLRNQVDLLQAKAKEVFNKEASVEEVDALLRAASDIDAQINNDGIVRIYSVDSAKKLQATQIAHRLHYTLAENGIVTARAAAQIAGTFIPGFAAYKLSKNNSGSTARNTAAAVVAGAFGFKAAKSIVEEYAPITLAELVEEKEKRFVRGTGSTDSQSIVRAFCKGRFMLNRDVPTVSELTTYKALPNYQANLDQVNHEFQLYTNQGIRLLIEPREEFLEHLVNYREVLNPLLKRAETHSMPKSKFNNVQTVSGLINRAEKDIDTYKTLFAMSLEEERNRRQNRDS